MNVLIVSTYHSSANGGAAVAAHRIHNSLHAIGVMSRMLVYDRAREDDTILTAPNRLGSILAQHKMRFRADTLWPMRAMRYPADVAGSWDIGWLPSAVPDRIHHLNPDVVHLHWVNNGFVAIQSLRRIDRPLVWTLHDSWAFTGGCHYSYDCTKYQESCGRCPQLRSGKPHDLSRRVWRKKAKAWRDVPITVVTPSRWLADCARSSSLFRDRRIEVIPNPIDLTRYRPLNKAFARDALGLPQDKRLILFGAVSSDSDRRKGFHHLTSAVQQLSGWRDRAALVVFGASKPYADTMGLPVHTFGHLHDEISLTLMYSAADVFVLPSLQENFPNTIVEAMACGTPCVAFDIGGFPDTIEHHASGYLAEPYDPADLAAGIQWVIEDDARWQVLSTRARQMAETRCAPAIVAQQYRDLYQSLL